MMTWKIPLGRGAAVALAAAVLAIGCASSGGRAPIGQRNLVTSEQLARAGDVSLYDALVQIRPTFLRSRETPSPVSRQQGVTVYIRGLQMMEGIAHLREIMAKNVEEVRFLEPQQANAQFGGNNNGGALVVIMK